MEKSKLIIVEKDFIDQIIVFAEENGGEVIFDESHDLKTLLITIGITSNYKGFLYINDAVLYIIENNEAKTDEIYEKLAIKYHVSKSSVERNIRYAIDNSEFKGNEHMKKRIFDNVYDIYNNKITNAKYLFALANYLAY